MFEGKKGKVLLCGLILLIVIILGVLVFFVVDFIKSSNIENDASDAVDRFEGEVNKKNEHKNTQVDEDISTNIQLNIQIEDFITNSGTGADSEKMYKGFPMVGTIEIPKLNLKYPVLKSSSKEAIEVAVAVDNGVSQLNLPGLTVIAGHNYRNGTFFSDVKTLNNGDKIYITDLLGNKVEYKVYDSVTTTTDDSDYLFKDTKGKRELILKTCTDDTQSRLLVYATAD